jgi:hypothetical protein
LKLVLKISQDTQMLLITLIAKKKGELLRP